MSGGNFCRIECLSTSFRSHLLVSDDHKMARQYADKFLKSAQLSGNHSQIQLSFHVTAWIIEKLWVLSGSVKSADLEEVFFSFVFVLQFF